MFDKSSKAAPQFLLLCQLFYPELVSTGQTLTELCEELTDSGMRIEAVCGPPTVISQEAKVPKRINYRGIQITRVWGTRFPKLNLAGRITNQITFAISVFFHLLFDFSKRPVLVLTNPPFLAVACAILRALRIGKPYVYLIFDVYPDTAVQLGVLKKNGFISRIWNRLNGFVFKHSAAVIVIGRCMRDVVAAKMKMAGLNMDGRIHNIPVWSDDKLIQSALGKANPFLEKWNLRGKFVVGYFGNMGRFHDMETIMEAAAILSEHKDIVFLFVGEGHKKQYIIDFADKYNLHNCRFQSYVDRKDLGFSLSSANVGLVSLAQGHEGLSVPSKTFGLMAVGVPVVAVMSPLSEIARIVAEEGCGLVVKPADSQELANTILHLYNNPCELELMGKNAIRAVNTKYNLRSAAKAYYELICSIEGN